MRLSRMKKRRVAVLLGAALGAVASIAVAVPAAAAVDIAAGRPATADSVESGHAPSAAVDADPATRWCANDAATGHWWQVDLGGPAALTGAQLVWEFARDYRYRVDVSADASAWTTVADHTGGSGSAQTRTETFSARARFLRITVTGLPAGTWACLLTVAVYGTPDRDPYKGLAGGDCPTLAKLNAAWYYNWWVDPGDCAAPGFVPMISGRSQRTPDQVRAAVNGIAAAGYRTVLGINEPNKADQADMTVAQVLDLWPAMTSNSSIRVGSPATSGDGQAWTTDFLNQATARGYRIDFLNVHWYGWNAGSCDANASTFESYLRWAESLPGNRPIWVTEWGCLNQSAPDAATVQRFYNAAIAVFARHPRVERQSFYPWINNHELLTADGTLTPLGRAYAATPAYR